MKPRQLIEVICIDCGCSFKAKSTKALRCEKCRKKLNTQAAQMSREKRRAKERRSKKTGGVSKMSIREVLKQMEAYNKEHGTKLSYGKFVAMLERGGL